MTSKGVENSKIPEIDLNSQKSIDNFLSWVREHYPKLYTDNDPRIYQLEDIIRLLEAEKERYSRDAQSKISSLHEYVTGTIEDDGSIIEFSQMDYLLDSCIARAIQQTPQKKDVIEGEGKTIKDYMFWGFKQLGNGQMPGLHKALRELFHSNGDDMWKKISEIAQKYPSEGKLEDDSRLVLSKLTGESTDAQQKILVIEFDKRNHLVPIYDLVDTVLDAKKSDIHTVIQALKKFQTDHSDLYGFPNKSHDEQDPQVTQKESYWNFHNLIRLLELREQVGNNEGELHVLGFGAAGSFGAIYLGQLFRKDEKLFGKKGLQLGDQIPSEISIGSSAGSLYPAIYLLWREASMYDPEKVPFTLASLISSIPDLRGKTMFSNGKELMQGFMESAQRLINIINGKKKQKLPNIENMTFDDLPGIHVAAASRMRENNTVQAVIFSGNDNLAQSISASSNPYEKIWGFDVNILYPVIIGKQNFYDGFHTRPNPGYDGLSLGPNKITFSCGYPGTCDDIETWSHGIYLKNSTIIPHKAETDITDQGTDWDKQTAQFRVLLGYYGRISINILGKITMSIGDISPDLKQKIIDYISYTPTTSLISSPESISGDIDMLLSLSWLNDNKKEEIQDKILLWYWKEYGYFFSERDKKRTLEMVNNPQHKDFNPLYHPLYIDADNQVRKQSGIFNIDDFSNRIATTHVQYPLTTKELITRDPLGVYQLSDEEMHSIVSSEIDTCKRGEKCEISRLIFDTSNVNTISQYIRGRNGEQKKQLLHDDIYPNIVHIVQTVDNLKEMVSIFENEITLDEIIQAIKEGVLNNIRNDGTEFTKFLDMNKDIEIGKSHTINIFTLLMEDPDIKTEVQKYYNTISWIGLVESSELKIIIDCMRYFPQEVQLKIAYNIIQNSGIVSFFIYGEKYVQMIQKVVKGDEGERSKLCTWFFMKTVFGDSEKTFEKMGYSIPDYITKYSDHTIITDKMKEKVLGDIYSQTQIILDGVNALGITTKHISTPTHINVSLYPKEEIPPNILASTSFIPFISDFSRIQLISGNNFLQFATVFEAPKHTFLQYLEKNISKIEIKENGEIDVQSIAILTKEYIEGVLPVEIKKIIQELEDEANAIEGILHGDNDTEIKEHLKTLLGTQYDSLDSYEKTTDGKIKVSLDWEGLNIFSEGNNPEVIIYRDSKTGYYVVEFSVNATEKEYLDEKACGLELDKILEEGKGKKYIFQNGIREGIEQARKEHQAWFRTGNKCQNTGY